MTYLADFASGMEQTLKCIAEKNAWAQRYAHRLDGFHDGTDDVWRGFETVGPDEVH